MYTAVTVNDMKILLCRLHLSHATPSVLLTTTGTMLWIYILWKHNITVITPGDKQHPSCELNTAICLQDDTSNENHLLLDSINCVRGLEVAGLNTLLIPLKCLKNIHCTSRWEMPNFLPFPDVPVQMFSEEAFKGKVICLRKLRSCLPLLTRLCKSWKSCLKHTQGWNDECKCFAWTLIINRVDKII